MTSFYPLPIISSVPWTTDGKCLLSLQGGTQPCAARLCRGRYERRSIYRKKCLARAKAQQSLVRTCHRSQRSRLVSWVSCRRRACKLRLLEASLPPLPTLSHPPPAPASDSSSSDPPPGRAVHTTTTRGEVRRRLKMRMRTRLGAHEESPRCPVYRAPCELVVGAEH